jgi:hypothetical protein
MANSMIEPAEPRRPTPVLPLFILLELIVTIPIALRLSAFWRISVLCAYAALSVAVVVRTTAGSSDQNYMVGSRLGIQFFNAVHLLLLTDPLVEFRYEGDGEDPAQKPLLRRIFWVACVNQNVRGIGWNFQVCKISTVEADIGTSLICSLLGG